MIESFVLFGYVVAAHVAAPRLANRAWTQRAPRLSLALWQGLVGGAVLAVLVAGFALLFPNVHLGLSGAEISRAAARDFMAHLERPLSAMAAVVGALLIMVVVARVVIVFTRRLVSVARWRRQHAVQVDLIAIERRGSVRVLDVDESLVYCVPGRDRVIVTSGAERALSAAQLQAVLAHERAHLTEKHHRAVTIAATLRECFPWSRLLGTAHREVVRLVELRADDTACRAVDRLELAEAMLKLAPGKPRGALAAADSAGAQRVRRLIVPPPAPSRWSMCAASLCAVTAFALPVAICAAPELAHDDPAAASRSASRNTAVVHAETTSPQSRASLIPD